MKALAEYEKIVAIKYMSAGNDSIGDMWTDTKIFSKHDTLETVMAWVNSRKKDVILTIPEEY